MTFIIKSILLVTACIIVILTFSCGRKGSLTLKAYEKPASPANITAFHRDGGIYIFWQYPVQERLKIKGCQLLKSGDGGISFKELAFLKPDELDYTDRDFITGHDYQYKFRCISLRDVFSDDSVIIKISPRSLPQKPEEISSVIKNDSLQIRWKIPPDVKANIYKTFHKGSYSFYPINSEPLTNNFFVDKLEISRAVYYTVRLLRGTDIRDEGPPSDELEVNPAFFVPSSPSGLNYAPVEKKVYLLWKENPENWVKGYRIYRKRPNDDKFALIGETAAPVIIDAEPIASKTSYYVTAVGPQAESNPSETIEIILSEED
jgi:hypothetical protein